MHFGPFALDDRTWSLARDGTAIDLSPRLVEILAFFASRPGVIITKDELLERFWPDVHFSENTLTRAIADIRKAIGDDASQPTFLQTAARRGYRFIGGPSAGSHDVFAAWVKGRLALDSLDLARLPGAIRAFRRGRRTPSYPAHPDSPMPTCCSLKRPDLRAHPTTTCSPGDRDRPAACALDTTLGAARAVLAPLSAAGKTEESQAARASRDALEPTNCAISIGSRLPPGARNGCVPWTVRSR
jgi:DNA-binding winged helix-turn-helix (wHTH) protein